MNCEQAKVQLQHLTTGRLSGEEARAVRMHFASCALCQAVLTPSQWTEVLPALDETIEPSGEFTQRFHAKVKAWPKPWWRRLADWVPARPVAAAGALAAVVLAGIFVVRQPDDGQDRAAYMNDFLVAEKLPLFEDMAVVTNLDLLEDFDTIEDLPNLIRGTHPN